MVQAQTREFEKRQEVIELKEKGIDGDNLRRFPILKKLEHEKKKDGEFILKSLLEGDEGYEDRK